MGNLKPGDRIDCRIKDGAIVGPHNNYDDLRTFEVVAVDEHGYYLYLPVDSYLKGGIVADVSRCRNLNIDCRFHGETLFYITSNLVANLRYKLDGLCCARCQDFHQMVSPNRQDGTFMCYSCRLNPYR